MRLRSICIEFQGGFAAKHITIQFLDSQKQVLTQTDVYANDCNGLQTFDGLPDCVTTHLNITFNHMYDLFGRLVIYRLQLIQQ